MQKLNQQYESQVFNQKNAFEISEAEALLFAKAIELLECEGRKVLQPGTIANATDAINRKQLPRLFAILRPQAASFIGAVSTVRYWAWIDAADSLFDATGTRWPYLNQDRRAMYLSWVNCIIQEQFDQAA